MEPVLRPVRPGGVCVVMTCSDLQEADQVGQCLSELNTGCLVTYLRAEDMIFNAPAGRVALVILATDDSPIVLRRTLQWLHHRWPRCSITVVADAGCGECEMTAREGGATFLVRPVGTEQWHAILSHALREALPAPVVDGVTRHDDNQS